MTQQINKMCYKPEGSQYVENLGQNRPITSNRTSLFSCYLVPEQNTSYLIVGVQSIRASHWKFLVKLQFPFDLLEENIFLINGVVPSKAQTTSIVNQLVLNFLHDCFLCYSITKKGTLIVYKIHVVRRESQTKKNWVLFLLKSLKLLKEAMSEWNLKSEIMYFDIYDYMFFLKQYIRFWFRQKKF